MYGARPVAVVAINRCRHRRADIVFSILVMAVVGVEAIIVICFTAGALIQGPFLGQIGREG